MNISKEWNDILGNYGYHLQHLQLFTSPVAISISVFAFSLFYKRNVYHDNFRIVIQALTISLLSNNMMIFSHSYTSFNDDSFKFDLIDDIEKMRPLKGNIHICDKYSPIPLPLMFINVSMLFVLIIERNVAICTFGKYEKLQFGNTIYYFCIPLWLFSLLLIVYDFFAIVGIDGNFLFKFCHSVFVQKFYWKFSLPYVTALPPLVLITSIFIKNYKYAKIQAVPNNNDIEDYLSARFQIIENIRSNALLAILSVLLSTVTIVYTFGLFVINNPQPKTITFFMEISKLLFSLFTICFYVSMIYMTPVFNNKISRYFNTFMKPIFSMFLLRNNYCVNMIKEI